MPFRRVKHYEPICGIVLLISGVVLPSILALVPFFKIPFLTLIACAALPQVGALIFGVLSWQRTQGKIVAFAAATLLILMGALVMLLMYVEQGGIETPSP